MTDTGAFLTSLLTSFAIFCGLVVAFIILSRRPSNDNMYYPKRILSGRGLPRTATKRNPFGWVIEAFVTSEEELVQVAGLDAAIYINFYTTALKVLTYTAIFCVPVLIPIAVTSHNNEVVFENDPYQTYQAFDNLAIGNVEPGSPKLWAFLIGIYWLSTVTYYVLVKNYKHMIHLREKEQSHEKARPEQYACLVRDIPQAPKHMDRNEQVHTFFKKLHPDTYESCKIVTNFNKIDSIWSAYQNAKRKLAHAKAVYEETKTTSLPAGTRPMHKTGLLGLVGSKVDTIEYYTEKAKELGPQVEAEKRRTLKDEQMAAAFVFFNSRRAAAEASQVVHAPCAMEWQVFPAPGPREIVWNNLSKPVYKRMVCQFIAYFLVFMTLLIYMFLIALIFSLTTPENLVEILPFIKVIVNYPLLNTLLQAYLPQTILKIFLAPLPSLLMSFSRFEGIPSQSHLVRATSGKCFYFIVFNFFIGVIFFGAIGGFDELLDLRNLSISNVVSLFGNGILSDAAYFITVVALQLFSWSGLEISRLKTLATYHVKKRFLCKTEDEVKEAWAPGAFSYERMFPYDMLILTITLAYSVIAPLILFFGILYFAIGYIVLRNQALEVYVPAFESNGRMWPHIHSRILASLLVAQITMIGYLSTRSFPYAFLIFILPIFTIFFSLMCKMNYYPSFQVTSLAIASEDVKDVPSLRRIIDAYTPACLLAEEVNVEDGDKFDPLHLFSLMG